MTLLQRRCVLGLVLGFTFVVACPEETTQTDAADASSLDRQGQNPDTLAQDAETPDAFAPDLITADTSTAPDSASPADIVTAADRQQPDAAGGADSFVGVDTTRPDAVGGDAGPVIRVGPGRQYTAPCAVSSIVQDGDTVEIDAAEYVQDVCAWNADNLTLRGVGGYAHLNANGTGAQGKAIWVIKGDNTVVEHIEFSNAAVPDGNGAGIRQEGTNLTVRHCYFHDSENGILTSADAQSEILIEYSIFERNGAGDGYTHNMYIGHVKKFTLRHSWTHHAVIGHDIKSRAHENHILYNRIVDRNDGTASYEIDLPNGGLSFIVGNVIQQSPTTDNSSIISFGREGLSNPSGELYVVNNTMVNDRSAGTFINFQSGATVTSTNNLFIGNGTTYSGSVTESNNLSVADGCVVDRAGYDFHLDATCSTAINQGTAPGSVHGVDLAPQWQYLHPADRQARSIVGGATDIGAYEFGG